MAGAFTFIRQKVNSGGTNEYEVQKFISEGFKRANLMTDDPPSSASTRTAATRITALARRREADPQGRLRADRYVGQARQAGRRLLRHHLDGRSAANPPKSSARSLRSCAAARDAGIEIVQDAFAAKRRTGGWEVDKATRDYITSKGYGKYFAHRTGHSIGVEVHSTGANMDNLETQDDREMIPNTCFSIEPGHLSSGVRRAQRDRHDHPRRQGRSEWQDTE